MEFFYEKTSIEMCVFVNSPLPLRHAFSCALQNTGAYPNNVICVFPVRVFFLKGFTVTFPQKKSFFVFFFSILKIKQVSKIIWVKQM